jgi:hypothetical protein
MYGEDVKEGRLDAGEWNGLIIFCLYSFVYFSFVLIINYLITINNKLNKK